MHHSIQIKDEFKMQERAGGGVSIAKPVTKEYEVVSKTGLFKNGKQYTKGEKIMLVDKAAKNFLASGDIKNL